VFRLMPEEGDRFPPYRAGQYIALRRNDCRLTKKVVKDSGVEYVPDLDAAEKPKMGPVTHSYSIASAPFETQEKGYLEFYVVLEIDEKGNLGRLTEAMFHRMGPPTGDHKLIYYDKIAGNFTLDDRAKGFKNVLFVGTGTGVAPFVSMVKQLHEEARLGKSSGVRYTLIHANRTYEELDYRGELATIEEANKFDFVYIPSVSRPRPRDLNDPKIGKARANNLLRHILEMPLKEEEDLKRAELEGGEVSKAKAALEKTTRPVLPEPHLRKELQARLDPSTTVILTCGNASLMAGIQHIADAHSIHFEKEDW